MSSVLLSETEKFSTDRNYDAKWKTWCRLCANDDVHGINLLSGQCSQDLNSELHDINMVHSIGELFQIHLQEDEKLSQIICLECWKFVKSIIKFSERVNKVQQLYAELYNCTDKTTLDLGLLLDKYGIFKSETLITQQGNELPVEEIFVAELTVTSEVGTNIKNECIKVTEKLDTIVQETKDEFNDPIGDEEGTLDQMSCTSSMSDDISSNEDNDDTGSSDCEIKSYKKGDIHENISKELEHLCSICSQSFQRRSIYSRHMKKKHGVIVCPQCPTSFKTESTLKLHMVNHRKLFSCPQCDQKFERKGSLGNHIRNDHKFARTLVCEECGEALRTKKQLKQHMLTHTDYTPFVCKECGKSFKEKYRLKRHLETHGDKLICTECGKQLSCRATLRSHMLVHSDKMPHKCDYCGRAFKRAKTLKYHLIAHTGLRPYSCDFCDKTFSTGSSCRLHKKTLHKVELAALEASGAKAYTKNVPNLDALRAVARTGENLMPLASKQNGYGGLKNT
ncbi:zinc finger protein weckle-like isoform X1 [Bactrocera neohumeralis]|uniref:zinc finger protein weckle-like isoform X1 n=1 Tax=Bactrocera tryoni TaxID=59916 RepID=UPI001A96A966|nr:zinc finger protein weckle-like isoform X1 [Bactrocera tryoni]XP_050320458.1 zinc finger protein weckle-like isoform X1 [Bactrocera neohumeralis]